MKAPTWQQNVLLVSDDLEITASVSPAFGKESSFVTVANTQQAIAQLERSSIQVLIIDAKTTNPKQQYFDESDAVPFIELSQYASQLNLGLTIILLVNKLHSKDGNFARKCGAMLIMDRKSILINRMIYLIRVLRKRTFRTIFDRDIAVGTIFSVDLYHYLSLNERYAVFLPAGSPFSYEKIQKIQESHLRHLYVKESDLGSFLSTVRETNKSFLFSEALSSIRNQYRQLLIQFFDVSTDGMIHFGKELYEKGLDIIEQLEKLISHFPDQTTCLQELPYPRWSALAHGLNCAIYAIIFSKHCNLECRNEIAFAALIQNIGLAEIDQNLIRKKETDLSTEELQQYKRHITHSLDILRSKLVPFTPLIGNIILHHHENYDGTGFPEALAGENLPLESALISMLSSFDYFNTVRPGAKASSPKEAWERLKHYHEHATELNKKFHPLLLEQIDHFFGKLFS